MIFVNVACMFNKEKYKTSDNFKSFVTCALKVSVSGNVKLKEARGVAPGIVHCRLCTVIGPCILKARLFEN